MRVPLTSVYDHLQLASDRISTQIRTLTFGVLALVWLLLSSVKETLTIGLSAGNRQLLAIGGLCVLTLLIDLGQYWALYISANAVRQEAENRNSKEAEYNELSLIRRLQHAFFWTKQLTAVLATGWLLVIIAVSIIK